MSEITTIGLDLAKNVFQLHGADRSGKAVLRKKLRHNQVLAFLSTLALVLSPWKPVAALIFGDVRSAIWAMRCD